MTDPAFLPHPEVEPLDETRDSPGDPLPPALRDLLFPDTAPTRTFALLDGAKVHALPERIAAEGLETACLFTGEAAEDHGDVAPWLVALTPGAALTRALFTRGDSPQAHWTDFPGLVFHARAPLADLLRHFRRFTSIRDDTGRLMFWRFWDPRVWIAMDAIWPGPWTDCWPVQVAAPLDTLFFGHRAVLHRSQPDHPIWRALPTRAPDPHDVATLFCAMTRPALCPDLQALHRGHWALPHLAALAANPHQQDADIRAVLDTPDQSGKHQIMTLFFSGAATAPANAARFVRYVARLQTA